MSELLLLQFIKYYYNTAGFIKTYVILNSIFLIFYTVLENLQGYMYFMIERRNQM